jgi:hypothetical protein
MNENIILTLALVIFLLLTTAGWLYYGNKIRDAKRIGGCCFEFRHKRARVPYFTLAITLLILGVLGFETIILVALACALIVLSFVFHGSQG